MGKMKELWIQELREQDVRQQREQQEFYRVLDTLPRGQRDAFRAAISSVDVK